MDKELFKQHGGSTPKFSLKGMRFASRIVDVIDGDTIVGIIPLMNTFYKFHIRLASIDTSEIKSKDAKLKEIAIKAKNRLLELITDKSINSKNELEADVYLVWLKCEDFDKYGRLLANIYRTPECVKSFSEILLEEKLAYPYYGSTKLPEESQLEYFNS